MLIKEKRDETVKGRACTDSQKQREGSQKKYATPPKVALELVLITSVIDVQERRDMAMLDIPG